MVESKNVVCLVNPRLSDLRNLITSDFSKHWELNDPGHRFGHFNEVFIAGLEINEKLKLGQDETLILLAAFFHDLFTWDRTNHHELSANWVMKTEYRLIARLSESQKTVLSLACREHRASGDGQYSTMFSELMAAADRGLPYESFVQDKLEKAIQFRIHRAVPPERVRPEAIKHVQEKYGEHADKTFPKMWRDAFPGAIKSMRLEIANLV